MVVRFIADAYKPQYWYFEVIECVARDQWGGGVVSHTHKAARNFRLESDVRFTESTSQFLL